jgi:Zn-dependent protease with chaperone function
MSREEPRMRGAIGAVALSLALGASGLSAAPNETAEGYAEWREGSCLIVDGQKVCPAPNLKLKGHGEARSWPAIPLGYEVKVKKAVRLADGSLLAREVEAQPNGGALFESEVRAATDAMEAESRKAGQFYEGEGGSAHSIGRLLETGPQVARVRRIVDNLLPPYVPPGDVRAYVIENDEWNAFAMGNYSVYVFSGLLRDLDDDEVAIVLGHELVHATHEHSRKQAKKSMWIQLAALGALGATSAIDDDTKRVLLQVAAGLAASAWTNGYGRDLEDQADRVGLRYAYEAGYDITRGPALWDRFAEKYGNGSKAVNFFFSDHSQSAARAAKLRVELAHNYPNGPKPDGPARRAEPQPSRADSPDAVRPSGEARALAGSPPAVPAAGEEPGGPGASVRPGMTTDDVRRVLGPADSERALGDRVRWEYPDQTVIFENGRVVEIR